MVPEIYRYLDVSDIAGLIAPRPLLIEMGVHDTCFPIEDQLQGWEALWTDIRPGEHMFAANRAFELFAKYL